MKSTKKKILQSNLIQTGVTVKIQTGHCSTNELSPKLYLIAREKEKLSLMYIHYERSQEWLMQTESSEI